MTAVVPPAPARSSLWRWAVGPPGILFYLASVIAILIALDANSRMSFITFMIAGPIWFVIAAVWLGRFAWTVSHIQGQMPIADQLRWLVIPAAMGLIFLVTRTEVVFQTRLNLSREALDQMAEEVMAGGPTERGWVGLYNVGAVERTANGLRFEVDDSWLYRLGFAYSPAGEPALTEANYSPLWAGTSSESIGGGWWLWTEEWD
jgi:hypothetical protein